MSSMPSLMTPTWGLARCCSRIIRLRRKTTEIDLGPGHHPRLRPMATIVLRNQHWDCHDDRGVDPQQVSVHHGPDGGNPAGKTGLGLRHEEAKKHECQSIDRDEEQPAE